MFFYNQIWRNTNFWKCIDFAKFCANELKWVKIDVKKLIFCNSCYICLCGAILMACESWKVVFIEKYGYWQLLNELKKIPISKFDLNKGCLTFSFNDTTFIKGLLIFIIKFSSSLIF